MKTILGNKTWNGFGPVGSRNRAIYARGDSFCVYATFRNGEWSYGPCHYVGRERDKDLPPPTDKHAVVRIRVIPKQRRPTIYSMHKKMAQEYHNSVQR